MVNNSKRFETHVDSRTAPRFKNGYRGCRRFGEDKPKSIDKEAVPGPHQIQKKRSFWRNKSNAKYSIPLKESNPANGESSQAEWWGEARAEQGASAEDAESNKVEGLLRQIDLLGAGYEELKDIVLATPQRVLESPDFYLPALERSVESVYSTIRKRRSVAWIEENFPVEEGQFDDAIE